MNLLSSSATSPWQKNLQNHGSKLQFRSAVQICTFWALCKLGSLTEFDSKSFTSLYIVQNCSADLQCRSLLQNSPLMKYIFPFWQQAMSIKPVINEQLWKLHCGCRALENVTLLLSQSAQLQTMIEWFSETCWSTALLCKRWPTMWSSNSNLGILSRRIYLPWIHNSRTRPWCKQGLCLWIQGRVRELKSYFHSPHFPNFR